MVKGRAIFSKRIKAVVAGLFFVRFAGYGEERRITVMDYNEQ